MNKEDAANYLGISVRSLERYTQQNKIGATVVKGKTKPTPDYATSELDRFKREELERVTHKPVVQPMNQAANGNAPESASSSLARLSESGGIELLAQFIGVMQDGQAHKPTPSVTDLAHKLMLTIDEAVTLSGVGKSAINAAIKAGKLTAYSGYGRGKRIKRVLLEEWVAGL